MMLLNMRIECEHCRALSFVGLMESVSSNWRLVRCVRSTGVV
jgi:hypothetical protein